MEQQALLLGPSITSQTFISLSPSSVEPFEEQVEGKTVGTSGFLLCAVLLCCLVLLLVLVVVFVFVDVVAAFVLEVVFVFVVAVLPEGAICLR